MSQVPTQKHDRLQDAEAEAKKMSENKNNAAIVLSAGGYYVENDACPFIRTHETLVATYYNGKKLTKKDRIN